MGVAGSVRSFGASRSRIYGLLAEGLRFPVQGMCAAAAAGAFKQEIRAALAGLPATVWPTEVDLRADATFAQTLAEDYTGLFDVGSAAGPPLSLYEGEHGGGRMGVIEDVLRFYRAFGLRLAPAHRERPDHLATQLEFLHWLAFRQGTAEAAGENGSDYTAAARDFLAEHTLPLTGPVAEGIAGRHGFYAPLLQLAAAFAEADHGYLSGRVRVAVAPDPGRSELSLHRLHENGARPSEPYDLASMRARPMVWDRVVKASHIANCWYQRFCNLHLYIQDGLVLREEQVGNYPAPNDPTVPDGNPRGCQKGICYTQRLYDPTRVKYPMKRAGERGEGKWRRVSWDQALNEISDQLIDVLTSEGPQVVLMAGGSQQETVPRGSGPVTFFDALGAPVSNIVTEIGDDMGGVTLTAGKSVFCDSGDDWFHANVLLLWGSNAAYTQIANYHYISEARYRGARVISISPDYNASAMHADIWVPIAIGTDAALALAIAQIILRDGLERTAFIREQTDMPLLVRKDDGKLLRERDLKRAGREDAFYVYDELSRKVVEAPRKTLALGAIRPALSGEYEVKTVSGKVLVRPVCAVLREKLDREYTPEQASKITGVPSRLIERVAHEIAGAKGVVNIPGANFGKAYHGDLIYRAIMLVFALCGHMGRKGASFNGFPVINADTSVGTAPSSRQTLQTAAASDARYAAWKEDGFTTEMIMKEYFVSWVASGAVAHTSLQHFVHSGLLEQSIEHQSWDPDLKRPLKEYVDEAFQKGWQKVTPPADRPPRVMIQVGGNILRRGRSTNRLLPTLLGKLKLLVTIDTRMSSTAMYSDYVLPACSWYEKFIIPGNGTPIMPFLQVSANGMDPLYESASDRAIFVRFAKALARRAKERGMESFLDGDGKERRFDRVVDAVTSGGLYDEGQDEELARDAFENATNVERVDWDTFKDRGFASLTGVGLTGLDATGACDIVPGEPVVPLTWHTEKKEPYPTLTRRLQFYIDHDWFFELGEYLPTHKDPPKAGGDYPLSLTSGHARWSIHSLWTDDAVLLALQRGQPIVYLSQGDAAERGIADGEQVEAFNDVGRFQAQAVVAPGVRPGQAIIYHGWENYQFPGWRHFKGVAASPLNPIELVGGYGHVRPDMWSFTPGLNDRASRVDVRKIEVGTNA